MKYSPAADALDWLVFNESPLNLHPWHQWLCLEGFAVGGDPGQLIIHRCQSRWINL